MKAIYARKLPTDDTPTYFEKGRLLQEIENFLRSAKLDKPAGKAVVEEEQKEGSWYRRWKIEGDALAVKYEASLLLQGYRPQVRGYDCTRLHITAYEQRAEGTAVCEMEALVG